MNNGTWSGGKGSIPRKVNKKAYDDAYDRIFKKDIPAPKEDTTPADKKKEPTENELAFFYGCIVSTSLSFCLYAIIYILYKLITF
jgi:hypothetical protein